MAKRKRRRRRPVTKLNKKMRLKLLFLFLIILIGLCFLIGRLVFLIYTRGDKYQKKVLSSQSYDSQTLAFQRGNIVDANGTVLATSIAVYNMIIDSSVINSDEKYLEPTVNAIMKYFPETNREELVKFIQDNPENRYYKLYKKLPYDDVQPFIEMQNERNEKGRVVNPDIKGVWFETEYKRNYPFGNLASSVIGYTVSGDEGVLGLENYYNDTLNGISGRIYGYLNSDSEFEKTVIPAENGNNLICSIDANIQSVVEEKIKEFCDTYKNNARKGPGAENIGVVIMNPKNGEIMAMADYPSFDLNDPRNLSDYFTEEQLEKMTDDEKTEELNHIWHNTCVTKTYEPGSVQKPLTVACGLETGTLTDDMTFKCDGYQNISGQRIHCVNRNGHGIETVEKSLMDSCNDALMQMAAKIGIENFLTYQSEFGFGQRTGIDLPGEANTAPLIYTLENMKKIDLATNSFGQNYNCTMVQMASAFCSLINGGTYYRPHIVTKVTDSDNNTISTNDGFAVKRTISESTSEQVKKYLYSVVKEGTGNTAKVDGYSMGGKTGTAQMYDEKTHLRKKESYLVSFMGYVPYEDPQLVIYCIIDQPNVKDQAHSSYAQNVVREILEEVLPYMNIYPDEELDGTNKDLDIKGNNAPTGSSEEETPSEDRPGE